MLSSWEAEVPAVTLSYLPVSIDLFVEPLIKHGFMETNGHLLMAQVLVILRLAEVFKDIAAVKGDPFLVGSF